MRRDDKEFPLVYIIILNWNGKQHLDECLSSLREVDYPNYKVLFVDNASDDGSIAFVRENYPEVYIIQNTKNLGFAEGNNVGIRYAMSQGTEYVVLLNNDTRVKPDFLKHIVKKGEEEEDIGVLGGTVLMFFNPSVINSTGVYINKFGYGWDRDFGEDVTTLNRGSEDILAVTGCLMAIKREVIEKIGLLDREFFAYFEDIDFCIRVWKYTNYRVVYVPEAIVYHKFSASSNAVPTLRRYLQLRNQYRIIFKHFPLLEIIKIYPYLCIHRLRILAGFLINNDLYLFLKELQLMLKHWFFSPLYFLLRISKYLRKGTDLKRFWGKVIKEKKYPIIRDHTLRYEKVYLDKTQLVMNTVPPRIIMGINDEILGRGWSELFNGSPRFRKIGDKATCFLKNEKRFCFLQVHALNNSGQFRRALEIRIEGHTIGQEELLTGWHTYVFPFENNLEGGIIEVELKLEDLDADADTEKYLGINEVGLFPSGSPILRLN